MNVAWAHQSNFVSNFLSFCGYSLIHGSLLNPYDENTGGGKTDPSFIDLVHLNERRTFWLVDSSMDR
ncbi:hypothetical protein DERP_000690 [Dermatophagoides pteronyssinus]|uniref:Uncharacterized protein n=1 Tax=Dermatophagoides pteronyssinus TaxID=6956 RepID=A0ABQ8J0Z8_DERPT|nr:hypothetical protein DERP_000690 [Dermatophagoides pteronyssinus]